MHLWHRSRFVVLAAAVGFWSLGVHSCGPFGLASPFMSFRTPLLGQLSLPGEIEVKLRLAGVVDRDSVSVELDGVPLDPGSFDTGPGGLSTTLPAVAEGNHLLVAHATVVLPLGSIPIHAATSFDAVDLERPDECEILNDASCVLPFPSSRFLEPVGEQTETGLRMSFPEVVLEGVVGPPLDPAPLSRFDGYAPTAQILMNFPQGVDLEGSGAPTLRAGQPQPAPYRNVRTQDGRSTEFDSPTVLLDAHTGERVLHWVELDVHADGDPLRQVMFLRPGKSLIPGRRYIVAVRRLVDPDGLPVRAEPAFRALRDRRPSTIPSLEARRGSFEQLFARLKKAGVVRHDLVLAFDFVVRSERQLHQRMLSMRFDALSWLGSLAPDDASGFDQVSILEENDCDEPDQRIWRHVSGTFDGPYYLTGDMDDFLDLTLLNVDADGLPERNGFFPFRWNVAVPCSVQRQEETGHPLLMGHGFLGFGAEMVDSYVDGGLAGGTDVPYIAGATDWRGLARGTLGPDALFILVNVIGASTGPDPGHKFNNFSALPDRLMQGMVNTLVLSRMLKSGFFNRLPEFQRVEGDPATGVFTRGAEMFYFGVSLGGIYGTMYAALNQDTIRHNVDVPGMNFSILEQRSTQFPLFLVLIEALGLSDPMDLVILLQIQHEIWVSAEPAAYVRNVTGRVAPPLPFTPPKRLLMTVAFLDKQVSNQVSEIMARSLGIPNLVGSVQRGLQEIPDRFAGPKGLGSALVIYDVGDFDIFDAAFDPFLPPLANDIPSSKCDPHGTPRLSIPASQEQLSAFLRPGGRIFNFCDGACDAQTAIEQPSAPCDPLAP